MSQSTTTPPAPVVPIRPTSGPYPAPYWPSGPACPPAPPDAFSAMARLMSCYEDVRLATEFLSKVMTDIIENNPAVTTAIVEAIQKAGSSLPTIGVTDGSWAQPGQVGELVQFSQSVPLALSTGWTSTSVSMGVLQPGDWDMWAEGSPSTVVQAVQFYLNPVPTGFKNNMAGYSSVQTGVVEAVVIPTAVCPASFSQPTLIAMAINYISPDAAATLAMDVFCRRVR